ncbi:MAG: hypothetical protein ACI90V_012346, partial [Bacillariaceae sp.]
AFTLLCPMHMMMDVMYKKISRKDLTIKRVEADTAR